MSEGRSHEVRRLLRRQDVERVLVAEIVNRQRTRGHHGKRVHSLAAGRAVYVDCRPLGLWGPSIKRGWRASIGLAGT